MCVNCKTNFYRNDASSYINQRAHLISKEITVKEAGAVSKIMKYVKQKMLSEKRKKLYHKYGNNYYKTQLRLAKHANCILVSAAKCTYCRSNIADYKND